MTQLIIKKSLFTFHRLSGLVLGVFFFLLCLSGSILIFKSELEEQFFPEEVFISQKSPSYYSINKIQYKVKASYPNYLIGRLYLPQDSTRLYKCFLVSKKDINEQLWVTVNPYTLKVNREGQNLITFLVDLHHHLLLPHYWGSLVLFIISLVYFISTITGPYLKNSFKKGFFKFPYKNGFKGIVRSFHGIIGYWSLAFHLIMLSTSMVITFATVAYGPLGNELLAQIPRQELNYSRLISSAQKIHDLPIKHLQLAPQSVTVFMIKGKTINDERFGNAVKLTFDADSYELKSEAGFYKDPIILQALNACTAFHFGRFGGLAVKWLYAFMGFLGALLSLSGLILFFLKKPKKKKENTFDLWKKSSSWSKIKEGGIWSFQVLLCSFMVGLFIGIFSESVMRSSLFLMVHVTFVFQLCFLLILLLWPFQLLYSVIRKITSNHFMKDTFLPLLGAFIISTFLEACFIWGMNNLGLLEISI